jgi:hypothetical protein
VYIVDGYRLARRRETASRPEEKTCSMETDEPGLQYHNGR